ncbi:hypothetical protein JM18_001271 [Phytophthora kernoviae]|uniref:Uncharacterized protein n=2 Tax=Phytophthora kernoviae TaxID=325452 RepID=A0A921VFC2_9STRA|nr:hypothetical protein G195_003145 [Phytophthora kernoviae 00238/432]KAG2532344.1 hypothetical protein JM18_001271 [Phytophthora kernoviae]
MSETASSLAVDNQAGTEVTDTEETIRMVDAAYSRFSNLEGEPDLTQHKIEEKNERCEYHSCPNRARVSQAYGKFCNRHVIVAPCGFPGCRDKAAEQAVMCTKHLKEGKDALYKILANRPQNVPVCRQFGCFKNDQGRGYCRGHEKLLMATGRLPPHINKRRLNSAYTMCSYPDCNRHSQRNHLCRTHGNLVKNQAQELAERPENEKKFEEILDRMQKEIRRCTHENCTKNSQRDRLCTLHYYEKHKLQKGSSGAASKGSMTEGKIHANQLGNDRNDREQELADAATVAAVAAEVKQVSPTASGKMKKYFCKVDKCDKQAQKRGLCKRHFRLQEVLGTTSIAGAVSGSALLLDSPSRRSTISLYIFVRMLDVVCRHLMSIGVIPTWRYSSETLFAISNAAIMYAFVVDPSLLPKGYYQWICRIGAVNHYGLEYTIRQRMSGQLDAHGQPLPFRLCQPHYHMESCVTHAIKEWINGLGRSMQIYLPVHFLPAMIFRFQQLQGALVSTTARISYSALCSSAFLTSYQTVVKLVVCTGRNAFHRDFVATSLMAGIATGGSLFFEHTKRRFELMLYCFPRALDIVWQLLKRRGLVRYVKHSEVVLFCLSMALIMSSPARHFKPTYLRILRFIFGGDII